VMKTTLPVCCTMSSMFWNSHCCVSP